MNESDRKTDKLAEGANNETQYGWEIGIRFRFHSCSIMSLFIQHRLLCFPIYHLLNMTLLDVPELRL